MHEMEDREKVEKLKFGQVDPSRAWHKKKSRSIVIGGGKSVDQTDKSQKASQKVSQTASQNEYDLSQPRLTKEQFKQRPMKSGKDN